MPSLQVNCFSCSLKIKLILNSISDAGTVEIANYNTPNQIVIGGEKDAVNLAQVKLTEAGARKVIPLKVSGPFHTSMLNNASKKLGTVIVSGNTVSAKKGKKNAIKVLSAKKVKIAKNKTKKW